MRELDGESIANVPWQMAQHLGIDWEDMLVHVARMCVRRTLPANKKSADATLELLVKHAEAGTLPEGNAEIVRAAERDRHVDEDAALVALLYVVKYTGTDGLIKLVDSFGPSKTLLRELLEITCDLDSCHGQEYVVEAYHHSEDDLTQIFCVGRQVCHLQKARPGALERHPSLLLHLNRSAQTSTSQMSSSGAGMDVVVDALDHLPQGTHETYLQLLRDGTKMPEARSIAETLG